MSDTPRTDRAWRLNDDQTRLGSLCIEDDRYKESSKLERELNAANAKIAELIGAQPDEKPTPYAHELFVHMHDEHGLTLVESELVEIMRICQQISAQGSCVWEYNGLTGMWRTDCGITMCVR